MHNMPSFWQIKIMDTESYKQPGLNDLCKNLINDNAYRKLNLDDTDEYSNPKFSKLIMEVPLLPSSPETVDYEPVPMCRPGWLHMGGGWYGV